MLEVGRGFEVYRSTGDNVYGAYVCSICMSHICSMRICGSCR